MNRLMCFIILFVVLFLLPVLGWCNAQIMNQSVLINSKINDRFIKGIIQRIRKTLPKDLKSCSLTVVNVTILQRGYKYPDIAEEWTVDVCRENKAYFIANESPKGKYYTVTPKEIRIAKEKEIWDAVKNDDKDGEWRATLFYINEIEIIEQKNK